MKFQMITYQIFSINSKMKNSSIKFFWNIKIIISLFFSLFFFIPVAQTQELEYNPNPIIGLVDGKPVTFNDIRNNKIYDLSLNLYQHLNIQFIEYSLKKLEKKYPIIDLIPKKKVSSKDLIRIYEQNNLKERGTFEELEPQIRQFLEKQILQQHLLNQYSIGIKKGLIVSHLEIPSKFFTKGNIKTAYLRGNKKASVVLIEFSDYHCPFCRKIQTTINKLIKNFGEKVAFGYRHFPLSFHKEADEAAISSECAREQGKFEEMHHLLYSGKKSQTKSDLKQLARKIKIRSTKTFDNCLENEKYRGLINQDIEDASKLGITGTPGFFLGHFDHKSGNVKGEILSGALPYNSFKESIEKYLKDSL